MIVKEYGKSNKDIIMLLHGGGLSWWNYEEVSEILKSNYHVILPILDGHSGSDRDFTSIESNANEIIEYIDNNYNGNVKLIGGLSLGAQILLDILSKRDNICEYAIIESALVYPMKMTNKLIESSINMSYGLINKKWFSKLQFKSLKIKEELFDKYYIDSSNITKDNMISFLKANSNYHLKNIKTNKSKSIVIVGSKERPIMIKSAKIIHDELINSELEILSGYYHGDLSINHPNEYAEKVKKLIK
jgi:hypothetical protein